MRDVLGSAPHSATPHNSSPAHLIAVRLLHPVTNLQHRRPHEEQLCGIFFFPRRKDKKKWKRSVSFVCSWSRFCVPFVPFVILVNKWNASTQPCFDLRGPRQLVRWLGRRVWLDADAGKLCRILCSSIPRCSSSSSAADATPGLGENQPGDKWLVRLFAIRPRAVGARRNKRKKTTKNTADAHGHNAKSRNSRLKQVRVTQEPE